MNSYMACDYYGTVLYDCGSQYPIDERVLKFSAPVAALELGLRWLYDRSDDYEYITPCIHLSDCLGQLELGLRWLHDRSHDELSYMIHGNQIVRWDKYGNRR